MIADINDVYAYCGLFILFGTGTLLTKVYAKFILAIKDAIIVDDDLDYCRRTGNNFHFCNTYYSMIVEKQILKFGFANCINILLCQEYPDVLSDLTFIKEAFIAFAYPIMSIINLKPSRTSSTAFYHWI